MNKTFDKKMGNSFLFYKAGSVDFGAGIIKSHPELSLVKKIKEPKKREKLISDYVDNFYKHHFIQLKKNSREFQRKNYGKSRKFSTLFYFLSNLYQILPQNIKKSLITRLLNPRPKKLKDFGRPQKILIN